MSIYRINEQNRITDKIRLLNEMIIEVSGLVSKSSFNKNEIDQLFTDLAYDRKFLRNQSVGNSLTTYTNWSHFKAESGYSIWKYTGLTNYTYNALNALYLDNKALTNVGEATSTTATTFDKVFFYNGDSGTGYTDFTTEAGTETGTPFELMDNTTDYLYIGDAAKFSGIKFEFETRGSNYTNVIQYWNGASWTTMTALANDLDDDTSNFESDGDITFTAPTDWATTSVNSSTQYWIRISTSTDPTTDSRAYYIIPNASVAGLLALSSSEIINEDWAWCTYGTDIYVTIRNSGNTNYEGDFYITSSSSATNLQNYFISNHAFTADYEDSTYVASSTSSNQTALSGTITIDSGTSDGDVVYISGEDTFRAADATDNTKIGIGIYKSVSGSDLIFIAGNQIVNTVGSDDIVAGDLVYLSETDGKVTKTPPSSSGNIVQRIGRAKDNESSGTVDLIINIDPNPLEIL